VVSRGAVDLEVKGERFHSDWRRHQLRGRRRPRLPQRRQRRRGHVPGDDLRRGARRYLSFSPEFQAVVRRTSGPRRVESSGCAPATHEDLPLEATMLAAFRVALAVSALLAATPAAASSGASTRTAGARGHLHQPRRPLGCSPLAWRYVTRPVRWCSGAGLPARPAVYFRAAAGLRRGAPRSTSSRRPPSSRPRRSSSRPRRPRAGGGDAGPGVRAGAAEGRGARPPAPAPAPVVVTQPRRGRPPNLLASSTRAASAPASTPPARPPSAPTSACCRASASSLRLSGGSRCAATSNCAPTAARMTSSGEAEPRPRTRAAALCVGQHHRRAPHVQAGVQLPGRGRRGGGGPLPGALLLLAPRPECARCTIVAA